MCAMKIFQGNPFSTKQSSQTVWKKLENALLEQFCQNAETELYQVDGACEEVVTEFYFGVNLRLIN